MNLDEKQGVVASKKGWKQMKCKDQNKKIWQK